MDLDDYAKADPTKVGYRSYLDTLPDDVQAQVLASSAGHATVARWLVHEGHSKATQQMVARWRQRKRDEAAAAARQEATK